MAKRGPKTKHTNQELIALYESGLTCPEIGKLVQLDQSTVRKRMVMEGFQLRPPGTIKNTSLNHDFFDPGHADEIVYYWAGFMLGDGYVTHPHKIGLTLKLPDQSHAQVLQNHLNFNGTPKIILPKQAIVVCGKQCNTSGSYTFRVSSKKLTANLSCFGVVPNKSKLGSDISLGLSKYPIAFILGLIDADGWIMSERAGFGLRGHPSHMEVVRDYLKSINIKLNLQGDQKLPTLSTTNKKYVFPLFEKFLKVKYSLQRKRELLKSHIRSQQGVETTGNL